MRYPTSAKLFYGSTPVGPGELMYRPTFVAAKQARLSGRVAYQPEIDLGLYRCRAVIDLIVLRVDVGRPSQFRHVKDALDRITGTSSFVEPVGTWSGRSLPVV
jgi:hypothetical protein